MWEATASIATHRDYALVAALAIGMPAFRWLLNAYMFEPLARTWIVPPHQRKSRLLADKHVVKVKKITESLWKIIMYSVMLVIGILATYKQSWAWDSKELWHAWPYQEFTSLVKVLYCLEMAFCGSSVAMLLLWEVRRRDFPVMMLHHVVTSILISASYYYNYLRVGCLVMMLHDINDILMEAAKTAKYCSQEALSTALFVAFVLSWAATRLTYFPWVIIRSALVESQRVLGYRPPGYVVFNGLLCVLLVIHCYWFRLILNIIWVKLRTGGITDVREEDEED